MNQPAKQTREDGLLKEIAMLRWPDGVYCSYCRKQTLHYSVRGRKSFVCRDCGKHTYPMAGTIFEKSTTPLAVWQKARNRIEQTRGKISAVTLQKELDVTYKTAWRMKKLITQAVDNGSYLVAKNYPHEFIPLNILASVCLIISIDLVFAFKNFVR